MAKTTQSRHVPGIIPRKHPRFRKQYLITALLLLASITGFTAGAQVIEQNNDQTQNLRAPVENPEALRRLAAKLDTRYRIQQQRVEEFIMRTGLPRKRELEDGTVIEIIDVVNGRPVFYSTRNLIAAITISTDSIWPGSGLFSLTGAGDTLGIWDEAKVYAGHQEFGNPTRVAQKDGATALSRHATACAGTMIASGNYVSGTAKGMAYAAHLHAYDWNNDLNEMLNAGLNGLKISNHSYGALAGWRWNLLGDFQWVWLGDTNFSKVYDNGFGYYDTVSYYHDSIANAVPDYLMVIGAGNDRIDVGPVTPGSYFWLYTGTGFVWTNNFLPHADSTYDCLPRGSSIAKNVLVVGAVDDIPNHYAQPSDIVSQPYSSYGPTDDGRIKPDLVASGDSLYTTDWTQTGYRYLRGTSAAAPTVTGSLGLLQKHYRNTHSGQHIKSATLKAVVIHTVDKADSTFRPDYKYGWGLLNTKKAAQLITADSIDQTRIQELTLTVGQVHKQTVYCDGSQPLRVTIAWNDPAGPVYAEALNNRSPNLTNDLDLSVINFQSMTYPPVHFPFSLNPNSPWAAATTTGPNNVDNVEYVYIETPIPGFYSINVGYKVALAGGQQDYALVISGASPMCKIPTLLSTSPIAASTGDTITFGGINFGPGMGNGFFGATAGTQAAATPAALKYTLGAGATYELPQITNGVCNKSFFGNLPIRKTFDCGGPIDELTFKGHIDFTTNNQPDGIVLADLNLDGYSEAIVANKGSNSLSIFKNNGLVTGISSVSFATKSDFPFPTGPDGFAVKDLDGDGLLDIVTTHASMDSVCICMNQSTTPGGSISFSQRFCLAAPAGSSPIRAAIIDIDLDSRPDIVTANAGSTQQAVNGSVSIFKNVEFNGMILPSSFLAPATFLLNTTMTTTPTDMAVADLDGDLQPEIITSNMMGMAITILQNVSNQRGVISVGGMFPATYNAINIGAPVNPRILSSVSLGDYNVDGKLDMAITNTTIDHVYILPNNSTWGTPAMTTIPETPRTAGAISFGPGSFSISIGFGTAPTDAAFANLDGDAYPDLAVVNSGNNTIATYRNTGAGSFMTGVSESTNSSPSQVAVGDVNNDDPPEIAVTNNGAGNFSVFENFVQPYRAHVAASGSTSVCQGQTVTLQASPTPPLGANYIWYRNGSAIMSGPTNLFMAGLSGSYTVTVQDSNGCTVAADDTIQVTIFSLPQVDAGDDDTVWIDTSCYAMTGHSPSGGYWIGDTLIDSAGNFCPLVPGIHNVQYVYVDSNGCQNMDSKVIIVLDTADAGIDSVLTDEFSCSGVMEEVKVILKNFGSPPLVSAEIHWKVNGTPQTTYNWSGLLLQNQTTEVALDSIFIDTVGTYEIIAWTEHPNDSVDSDHSNDTSRATLQCGGGSVPGLSGIDSHNGKGSPGINVWHSRVESSVIVELTFDRPDIVDILVYDMQGRLLDRRNVSVIDGASVVKIPSNHFFPGIYVCVASYSQGIYTRKFLKF